MSHAYPLAQNAEEALASPHEAARTRADAEHLAGDRHVLALETEWLTVSAADAAAMLAAATASLGQGFIQRYEDSDGAPVLAVTYWKLGDAKTARAAPPAPVPTAAAPGQAAEDHTDDLYFRSGRTKPSRRRKKAVDPNQMDLFGEP